MVALGIPVLLCAFAAVTCAALQTPLITTTPSKAIIFHAASLVVHGRIVIRANCTCPEAFVGVTSSSELEICAAAVVFKGDMRVVDRACDNAGIFVQGGVLMLCSGILAPVVEFCVPTFEALPVGLAPADGSLTRPARSCLDIRNAYPSVLSGQYYLHVDETSSIILATCDMQLDGGGWTLVSNNFQPSPSPADGSSYSRNVPVALQRQMFSDGNLPIFRVSKNTPSDSSRLFISDTRPAHVFGTSGCQSTGLHFWNSLGVTRCKTGILQEWSQPLPKQVDCNKCGVGEHHCSGPYGWILLHHSYTYNVNGQHPCAITSKFQDLTLLWIR